MDSEGTAIELVYVLVYSIKSVQTRQVADEDESPLAADGDGVRVVGAGPHHRGGVLGLQVDGPRPELISLVGKEMENSISLIDLFPWQSLSFVEVVVKM